MGHVAISCFPPSFQKQQFRCDKNCKTNTKLHRPLCFEALSMKIHLSNYLSACQDKQTLSTPYKSPNYGKNNPKLFSLFGSN
jgi:hypothetical protein